MVCTKVIETVANNFILCEDDNRQLHSSQNMAYSINLCLSALTDEYRHVNGPLKLFVVMIEVFR